MIHTQYQHTFANNDEIAKIHNNVAKKVIDLQEYELIEEGIINPFNKANKPITTNWVQNLLKKYGIYQNINNLEYYQQAFIHTSYTKPYIKQVCLRDNVGIKENPDGCMLLADNSYEKMEFLGDTIIESIIGYYIYRRFPDGNEGFLSTMKKQLISRWVLGHLADKCGFGEYMVISKTLDDKQNARTDIKKLCDVLEAFIAAIYLDYNKEKHGFLAQFHSGPGYQVAEKFLINLLEHLDTQLDMTSYIIDDGNFKTKLRNYLRRCKQTDANYLTEEGHYTDDKNPVINYRYKTKLTTKKNKNKVLMIGYGNHNKEAEQQAAHLYLISEGILKN
jgi:ribonuclease-3